MRAAHYRGSIDGDIKEYLKITRTDRSVDPTFTGYEPFKQLLDLNVVTPNITSIRLVHGFGSDEYYTVFDKENLEGVILKKYSGKTGLHNTKEILTETKAPFWEIHFLEPRAYRG